MIMLRRFLPFASLIIIVILLSIFARESFLTIDNLMNVLRRSSVYGIMAVGMVFIIIAGGIDLSVGSMMALAGMAGALVMQQFGGEAPGIQAQLIGTAIGILAATAAGFLNGALSVGLKLQPFIVTLGTMSLFRGIALVMNDGQPYNVTSYTFLGEGVVLGIPVSVILFAAVITVMALVLAYARIGRHAYAIGSNREAAFYAGIAVGRNLITIYTVNGFLAGIAAMIAVSRTVSAQPTAGNGAELDVIAAVVIGGASLSGGRGTVVGTVIGTLLISILRNGATLVGISTNAQLIVIGVIIIIAVAFDQLAQRGAAGSASRAI